MCCHSVGCGMAVGDIESFNFPMRYKLLCLVLLLEMFVASTPILRATGLRGGVVGLAGVAAASCGTHRGGKEPGAHFEIVCCSLCLLRQAASSSVRDTPK